MIENNLAVACWWDRYPNYQGLLYESSDDDSEEEFSEKAFRSKESDFSYSAKLFKKSIKILDRAFAYYSLNHSNQNLPFIIAPLEDMDFTYDLIENIE